VAVGRLDVDQFRRDGYCVLQGAVPKEVADRCRQILIEKMRFDHDVELDDPATYGHLDGYVPISHQSGGPFDGLNSPAVLDALDTLLGKGRYEPPTKHGFFFASLPGIHPAPWAPPRFNGRWHIDWGRYPISRYRIADGNCALTPIWLLSETQPGGGATCGIRGSHIPVARMLHQIPEVSTPEFNAFCEAYAMGHATDIVEFTGGPGDVLFAHPFFIHAASANSLSVPRFICNTGVRLYGDRNLHSDAADLSVIEQIIVDAVADRPTAPVAVLKRMYRVQAAIQELRYAVGRVPASRLQDFAAVKGVRRHLFRAVSGIGARWAQALQWASRAT
jgi:hypothetical protein